MTRAVRREQRDLLLLLLLLQLRSEVGVLFLEGLDLALEAAQALRGQGVVLVHRGVDRDLFGALRKSQGAQGLSEVLLQRRHRRHDRRLGVAPVEADDGRPQATRGGLYFGHILFGSTQPNPTHPRESLSR